MDDRPLVAASITRRDGQVVTAWSRIDRPVMLKKFADGSPVTPEAIRAQLTRMAVKAGSR